MHRLELRNVSKYFGKVIAVNNVSFFVDEGQFLTLLGPSGCGKTTTLRLIAGLERADAGEILINGEIVNARSPSERDIAMVFQSYALYPHMTVYKNIAIPLEIRRMPKDKIKQRVMAIAQMLGISDLLDRKPRELSGGQRQRTAIGRAIVREPNLFLLDEPLANLDAILRHRMRGELKTLFHHIHGTTVYVTHDQEEALAMSDSIIIINQGVIQQIGTPQGTYKHPANKFVANFVGTPQINIFKIKDFQALSSILSPQKISALEDLSLKGNVEVGIRPENVVLGEGPLSGTVTLIEPLGANLLVSISANIGPDEILIKSFIPNVVKVLEGDNVNFTLKESQLLFFLNGERVDVQG